MLVSPEPPRATREPHSPLLRAFGYGLRVVLVAIVFLLGMFTARLSAPPTAEAVVFRDSAKGGFYLPVNSRQLTVTLQPLVPSESVQKQLDARRSDSLDAARELMNAQGLQALSVDLARLYPLTYRVADKPLVLPDALYSADRQQYGTSATLDWLKKQVDSSSFKTVGLLYADVFDEGYNFLFGQARIAGPVCVVSSNRMVQDVGSKMTPAERWNSIVRHELGHTLGLQHVPDQRSVMAFGNSLQELDGQGTELTDADWRRLKELHPIRWEK
jgi:predicted Zn-dependent protease